MAQPPTPPPMMTARALVRIARIYPGAGEAPLDFTTEAAYNGRAAKSLQSKEAWMAEAFPERSPVGVEDDTQTLHKLGYAQELFRSMGGFQNFAISFTIISILAGCLTSYAIAFNQGGPVAITWGWLIVGGFCIVVSLAMGEIASTYPTAGGLYFWASRLGSPAWGWFTGWFNLVGQIAVTAAIGFGCAIFMTSWLNLITDGGYGNTYHWIYMTYAFIMLGAGLINMFKVPITAALNAFSAWWHMIGVLVIVGVLIIVPDHHRSL